MAMREYVGARYVPVFADPIQWDITLKYEPLTVVTDNGASYVSRRYVPEGIQLNDTDYWILWADYNAQLQQLIEDVNTYNGRIEDLEEALPVASFDDVNTVEAAISAIDTRTDALEDALPIADFDDVNTVSAGISALDTRIDTLEDVLPVSSFDDVNTVNAAITSLQQNTVIQSDSYTVDGITFNFKRFGPLVAAISSGTPTTPIPTNDYTDSTPIAAAFKPSADRIFFAPATRTATMQIYITSSGSMKIGQASESIVSANVRCAFCYFI